jgi:hypothetical protein
MNSCLRVFLTAAAFALVFLGSGCTATTGGVKDGAPPPSQVVAPMPNAKRHVYPTYSTDCRVGVGGGRIPGAYTVDGGMRGETRAVEVDGNVRTSDVWYSYVVCGRGSVK